MTQHSAPFSPCIDSLELFSQREKSVNVMTKILVCPLALSWIGRVLYCCREMMHVLLKMDFGFKKLCAEILRLREKEGKANLRAFIMPYYRNFMASRRLVSQANVSDFQIRVRDSQSS